MKKQAVFHVQSSDTLRYEYMDKYTQIPSFILIFCCFFFFFFFFLLQKLSLKFVQYRFVIGKETKTDFSLCVYF